MQAGYLRGGPWMHSILKVALAALLLIAPLLSGVSGSVPTIGNHTAVYGEKGMLQSWASWSDIVEREVNWYAKCPVENGYPRFVCMTFMDGNYQATTNYSSFVPSTQNGMGIISYLKYYDYQGRKDPRLLQMARYMGDYLVKEAVTPDAGAYSRFSRSTGWRGKCPQPPDCGSQGDRPYEIEPDKGGIAGYALLLLYDETHDEKYWEQALQNAQVLATNMCAGTATNSPWPFRVDYRTGAARGAVSGNMAYILRLFGKLVEQGHPEFKPSRDKLWEWIKDYQIPNLSGDGKLWVQFFEDHEEEDNCTAWAPLNLARYLIEKQAALDPDWKEHAGALIDFVNRRFITVRNGVAVCGEQKNDMNPWGGILSTYGAVLAMYGKATGSNEYKAVARQALNYCLYAVNVDGCPGDLVITGGRGGWQEDAHTDKLHNLVDAMTAYPEWAK